MNTHMRTKISEYQGKPYNLKRMEKHFCVKQGVFDFVELFPNGKFSMIEINENKIKIISIIKYIINNYKSKTGNVDNVALRLKNAKSLLSYVLEEEEKPNLDFSNVVKIIYFIKALFRQYLNFEFDTESNYIKHLKKNITYYKIQNFEKSPFGIDKKPTLEVEVENVENKPETTRVVQEDFVLNFINEINKKQCHCMNKEIQYEIKKVNYVDKYYSNVEIEQSEKFKLSEIDSDLILFMILINGTFSQKSKDYFKCKHGKIGIRLSTFKYRNFEHLKGNGKTKIKKCLNKYVDELIKIDEQNTKFIDPIEMYEDTKLNNYLNEIVELGKKSDFYSTSSKSVIYFENLQRVIYQMTTMYEDYFF